MIGRQAGGAEDADAVGEAASGSHACLEGCHEGREAEGNLANELG